MMSCTLVKTNNSNKNYIYTFLQLQYTQFSVLSNWSYCRFG